MADFNYYINRQGIRGLQGVKGDQGDSPIITVESETPNEYILKITNPDGTELLSPNLRGNKININEGTYVRYNTETGELYTSTADGATGELAGVVRLATDEDITDLDEKSAVTPSQLADALSQYLTSPDGSVKIVQNEDTSLTELTVESTGQDIEELKNKVNILDTEMSSALTNITNLQKTTESQQVEINKKSPELTAGDNITLTPQTDGTIKISSTASGTGDVTAAGNNVFTGQNQFNDIVAFNSAIDSHGEIETTGEIYAKNYITTDKGLTINIEDGEYGGVKFMNGSNPLFNVLELDMQKGNDGAGDPAKVLSIGMDLTLEDYTTVLRGAKLRTDDGIRLKDWQDYRYLTEEDVDGQTIEVVDGKLHVNMDELGNEVNDLSGRVTANEADITTIKGEITDITGDVDGKQNKLTAGDNITLTNNEDGTTTIAAESSVPTNMVTTDTEQTITGKKILPITTDIGGITFGVVGSGGGRYFAIPNDWTTNIFALNKNTLRYTDGNKETAHFIQVSNTGESQLGTVWEQTLNSFTTFNTSALQNGNGLKLYPDSDNKAALSCPNGNFTFLRSKDIDNDTIKLVDGKLTANVTTELPTASATVLGGVKIGDRLTITDDGVLSADLQTPTIDLIDGGNALGG